MSKYCFFVAPVFDTFVVALIFSKSLIIEKESCAFLMREIICIFRSRTDSYWYFVLSSDRALYCYFRYDGDAYEWMLETMRSDAATPVSRAYHRTITRGNSMVIFGGRAQGLLLGDVWQWSPMMGWEPIVTNGSMTLPPVAGHCIVHDSMRDATFIWHGTHL